MALLIFVTRWAVTLPAPFVNVVAGARRYPWHRFLAAEGTVTLYASRDVHPPAPARRLPKPLQRENVMALLDAVTGAEPRPLGARALLDFLYAPRTPDH